MGGDSRRWVEPFAEDHGHQVLRSDFDRLLLDLAQAAGARVQVEGATRKARFTLDCSGRAGVIARAYRVKPTRSRTIELCGVWHSEAGWKLPDASHTLVDVCKLVELAPHHRQAPELFEAYNLAGPAVDLPHFLTALSCLLAKRILVSQ